MQTLNSISIEQQKKKLKQIILNQILKQQDFIFKSYKQRRNIQFLQKVNEVANVEAPKYKQVQQLQKNSVCSNEFNEKIMELFQPFQKSLSSKKIMFKILKKENKNQQDQPKVQSKIMSQIQKRTQSKDYKKIRIEDTYKGRKSIQFSEINKKGAHSIESHDAMLSSAELTTTKEIKEEQNDQFMDSESQITGKKQKPAKKEQKLQEKKKQIVQIAQFRLSQSIDKSKPKSQVRYISNQSKISEPNQQQLPEQEELFLN